MRQLFEEFIDRLFESRGHADFSAAMGAAAAALDLPWFAYLIVPERPNSSPQLISSYPSAWTTHYLQSRYQTLDPVILWAAQHREPLLWGLGAGPIALTDAQRMLFDEAAEFEIRYGLTIPLYRNGGAFAAMTFAAGERYPTFERRIRRQARLLQLMAYCFHAHARRTLAAGAIEAPSLSPREYECMKWAAEGKSCWDIGRILNISHHTVAYHLDNAKAKLGVKTNVQAIVAFTSRRIS
jgi:DNA-binding CsgD family transcriptional regulator